MIRDKLAQKGTSITAFFIALMFTSVLVTNALIVKSGVDWSRMSGHADLSLTYKQPLVLNQFLTDRGKIVPRRISGNCAHHQRLLAVEIKRARNMALLPFTSNLPT